MRKALGCAALLLTLSSVANADATLEGFDNPDRVPDQYTVLLNLTPGWAIDLGDPASKALARAEVASAIGRDKELAVSIARELTQNFGGKIITVYAAAAKGFAIKASESSVRAMAHDPRIAAISANVRVSVTTDQSNAPWDLKRIGQRNLPLGSAYTYYVTGGDQTAANSVNVYVVDTGIEQTNPGGWDIVQWLLLTPQCYNTNHTISCPPPPTIGVDCYNSPPEYGHGTEVASVVGNFEGNAINGAAKGAAIIDVRTIDCTGYSTTTNWEAAIDWLVQHYGGNSGIINMSQSTSSPSTNSLLAQAIATAQFNGWVIVGSAGPNQSGVDSCQYLPAGIAGVISVAGTTQTDQVSNLSPSGNCISIYAPAESVGVQDSNGAQQSFNGLSFAVPQVSGVAALWMYEHPGSRSNDVTQALLSSATGGVINLAGALLLSSCVPGNNAALDPNAPGFCGPGGNYGGGGGGGGGSGLGGGGGGPNAGAAVYTLTSYLLLH
jgi:hypothetical protein